MICDEEAKLSLDLFAQRNVTIKGETRFRHLSSSHEGSCVCTILEKEKQQRHTQKPRNNVDIAEHKNLQMARGWRVRFLTK